MLGLYFMGYYVVDVVYVWADFFLFSSVDYGLRVTTRNFIVCR